MSRRPRWIVTWDEDDEAVLWTRGTETEAATEAASEWGCDPADVTVRAWTDADERSRRNARRRERYAERRAELPEDRNLLASEDAAALAVIPMMAWLSLSDDKTGKPRCPSCGCFRRWRDFVGAPSSARIPGGVVDFAPSCSACRARMVA